MRFLLRTILLIAVLGGVARADLEDSVWLYRLLSDNPDCPTVERRLGELRLRSTVVVSIEGGGFVLDRPNGRDQLNCMIDALDRAGRRTKLLLLQDTFYLSDTAEALRRMRAVGDFAQSRPGLAGAVIDIEPYLDSEWKSGSVPAKRAVASRYMRLLKQLRKTAKPMRLEAAVPWWLSSADGVPEVHARHLSRAVDGLYVMLYGLGGRKEDSLTDRISKRFPPNDPLLRRGRVYFTLATEDEDSSDNLDQDLKILRQRYGQARAFAGTSVFHADTAYKGQ